MSVYSLLANIDSDASRLFPDPLHSPTLAPPALRHHMGPASRAALHTHTSGAPHVCPPTKPSPDGSGLRHTLYHPGFSHPPLYRNAIPHEGNYGLTCSFCKGFFLSMSKTNVTISNPGNVNLHKQILVDVLGAIQIEWKICL